MDTKSFYLMHIDHRQVGLIVFFLLLMVSKTKASAVPFTRAPEELFFAFDERVTVVSRLEEKVSEAPGTVIVITQEMIQQRGYTDLVDLLKDVPGFDIQERIGGQDGGTYVIPRGIWGNNKLQVLLNGIPLNPMNGTHMVFGHQLSLWHLKQVEILYGPASAVYGADAFSGVINLVTERPSKVGKEGVTAVRVGQNDTYEAYGIASKSFGPKSGIRLYAHGYRSNDFNMRDEYKNKLIDNGFGEKTHIYDSNRPYETPEQDYDFFFDGELSDWRLFGEYLYTRQPNNIQTSYYSGRSQLKKDKAEIRTFSIALENTRDFSDSLTLKSLFNYQYYELDPTSDYGRYTFDNYIYERSKAGEWREQILWRPIERTDLGLGLSVRRVSTFPYINSRTIFDEGDKFDEFPVKMVEIPGIGLVDVPPIRERDYWTYGVYAQASHDVTTKLKGIFGVRYDWDTFNHDKTVNPRIGFIFSPCDASTVKLLYGTAFISPSAYFRYKEWLGTNYVHLPPDVVGKKLEPEKISVYEINFLRRFSQFSMNLATFYSEAKDIIQEAGGKLSGVTLYQDEVKSLGDAVAEYPINTGRQRTFGLDLMINGDVTKTISYRLWYSFLNARSEVDGDTFDSPKVSTHKFGLGLTLRPIERLLIDLRSRWWSGIHTLPDNPLYHGGKIKGALILDAHISYHLPIEGVELKFDARNLLNVDYYTAGAQNEDHRFGGSLPMIPQRPRELYLELTFRY